MSIEYSSLITDPHYSLGKQQVHINNKTVHIVDVLWRLIKYYCIFKLYHLLFSLQYFCSLVSSKIICFIIGSGTQSL
jgi:hypothetical protein